MGLWLLLNNIYSTHKIFTIQVLKEQQNARREREAQRIRIMNADPFDLEAQRLIASEIEQKNIDQNMELAMEARYYQPGAVVFLKAHLKHKINLTRFILSLLFS